MKTGKTSGKETKSPKNQKFRNEMDLGRSVKKDRTSKRRLSIYDDFEDEEFNLDGGIDYDSSENPFD